MCSLDSPAASSYACFFPGTSHQFFGKPVAVGNTNGVQGGFGYADIRILAGYDRQLSKASASASARASASPSAARRRRTTCRRA